MGLITKLEDKLSSNKSSDLNTSEVGSTQIRDSTHPNHTSEGHVGSANTSSVPGLSGQGSHLAGHTSDAQSANASNIHPARRGDNIKVNDFGASQNATSTGHYGLTSSEATPLSSGVGNTHHIPSTAGHNSSDAHRLSDHSQPGGLGDGNSKSIHSSHNPTTSLGSVGVGNTHANNTHGSHNPITSHGSAGVGGGHPQSSGVGIIHHLPGSNIDSQNANTSHGLTGNNTSHGLTGSSHEMPGTNTSHGLAGGDHSHGLIGSNTSHGLTGNNPSHGLTCGNNTILSGNSQGLTGDNTSHGLTGSNTSHGLTGANSNTHTPNSTTSQGLPHSGLNTTPGSGPHNMSPSSEFSGVHNAHGPTSAIKGNHAGDIHGSGARGHSEHLSGHNSGSNLSSGSTGGHSGGITGDHTSSHNHTHSHGTTTQHDNKSHSTAGLNMNKDNYDAIPEAGGLKVGSGPFEHDRSYNPAAHSNIITDHSAAHSHGKTPLSTDQLGNVHGQQSQTHHMTGHDQTHSGHAIHQTNLPGGSHTDQPLHSSTTGTHMTEAGQHGDVLSRQNVPGTAASSNGLHQNHAMGSSNVDPLQSSATGSHVGGSGNNGEVLSRQNVPGAAGSRRASSGYSQSMAQHQADQMMR